jgi:hypothetical protein
VSDAIEEDYRPKVLNNAELDYLPRDVGQIGPTTRHIADLLATIDFYRRDCDRHRDNEKRLREAIWTLGLSDGPGSEKRTWASGVLSGD